MIDAQIVKDIIEHLSWDTRIDALNIQVSANDGRVQLSGTVPVFTHQQIAELACYDVKGVKSVKNNLRIIHPSSVKVPPDNEIKEHLENLFRWNQEMSQEYVRIAVTGGTVMLEGTVDAYWKKLRAEQMAASVKGVLGVKDKLSVVPTDSLYDRSIAQGITNALVRNAQIDVNTVHVKVKDGIVTLSGSVPNQSARNAAQEVAANTMGVIELNNQLELRA
jgi:osmotically-inducible protein OsmY